MSISVLEEKYVEPARPYSQRELKDIRNKLFRELRVGKVRVYHKKCDHFYFVKDKGRKEKDIENSNKEDVGNCSVCWRFSKTPYMLKPKALEIINGYKSVFFEPLSYISYSNSYLEMMFYRWLYEKVI